MTMSRTIRYGIWLAGIVLLTGTDPSIAHAQLALSIPTTLTAHPGDTVTVPVTLTVTGNNLDAAHGNGIASVGFAIGFNSTFGTVPGSSIVLGSLISNPSYNFSPYSANANESAGQIRTFSIGTPGTPGLPAGTIGPVAQFNITVPSGTAPADYNFTFLPTIGSTTTTFITANDFTTYSFASGLALTNGRLTVTPVPEPGTLIWVGPVLVAVGAARRGNIPLRYIVCCALHR
jgi:hypothetical protein